VAELCSAIEDFPLTLYPSPPGERELFLLSPPGRGSEVRGHLPFSMSGGGLNPHSNTCRSHSCDPAFGLDESSPYTLAY